MIEVVDNFLPESQFREIESQMMGAAWPWYFNDVVDSTDDTNDSGKYQFTYGFYGRKEGWINSGEKVIWPITQRINPVVWLRVKANLNPVTSTPVQNQFHIDMVGMTGIPFLTSIYYVNTTNGVTLFRDGTEVENISNRLITFDGNLEHTGRTCTDKKRRVLINFNYIPLQGG